MKDRFASYLKTFFKRREWDPNSISGLGEWELNTPDYSPAVTNTEPLRGTPHPHLPLSVRLKKVQADLDAFEMSLPDINGPRS